MPPEKAELTRRRKLRGKLRRLRGELRSNRNWRHEKAESVPRTLHVISWPQMISWLQSGASTNATPHTKPLGGPLVPLVSPVRTLMVPWLQMIPWIQMRAPMNATPQTNPLVPLVSQGRIMMSLIMVVLILTLLPGRLLRRPLIQSGQGRSCRPKIRNTTHTHVRLRRPSAGPVVHTGGGPAKQRRVRRRLTGKTSGPWSRDGDATSAPAGRQRPGKASMRYISPIEGTLGLECPWGRPLPTPSEFAHLQVRIVWRDGRFFCVPNAAELQEVYDNGDWNCNEIIKELQQRAAADETHAPQIEWHYWQGQPAKRLRRLTKKSLAMYGIEGIRLGNFFDTPTYHPASRPLCRTSCSSLAWMSPRIALQRGMEGKF